MTALARTITAPSGSIEEESEGDAGREAQGLESHEVAGVERAGDETEEESSLMAPSKREEMEDRGEWMDEKAEEEVEEGVGDEVRDGVDSSTGTVGARDGWAAETSIEASEVDAVLDESGAGETASEAGGGGGGATTTAEREGPATTSALSSAGAALMIESAAATARGEGARGLWEAAGLGGRQQRLRASWARPRAASHTERTGIAISRA